MYYLYSDHIWHLCFPVLVYNSASICFYLFLSIFCLLVMVGGSTWDDLLMATTEADVKL